MIQATAGHASSLVAPVCHVAPATTCCLGCRLRSGSLGSRLVVDRSRLRLGHMRRRHLLRRLLPAVHVLLQVCVHVGEGLLGGRAALHRLPQPSLSKAQACTAAHQMVRLRYVHALCIWKHGHLDKTFLFCNPDNCMIQLCYAALRRLPAAMR